MTGNMTGFLQLHVSQTAHVLTSKMTGCLVPIKLQDWMLMPIKLQDRMLVPIK